MLPHQYAKSWILHKLWVSEAHNGSEMYKASNPRNLGFLLWERVKFSYAVISNGGKHVSIILLFLASLFRLGAFSLATLRPPLRRKLQKPTLNCRQVSGTMSHSHTLKRLTQTTGIILSTSLFLISAYESLFWHIWNYCSIFISFPEILIPTTIIYIRNTNINRKTNGS